MVVFVVGRLCLLVFAALSLARAAGVILPLRLPLAVAWVVPLLRLPDFEGQKWL